MSAMFFETKPTINQSRQPVERGSIGCSIWRKMMAKDFAADRL